MITKSIVWTRTDGGVSITYYDDKDDYNKIVKQHITDAGGTIDHIEDGVIEKPSDREHRDCWKLNNSKLEVCQNKLALKLTKQASDNLRKEATLSKLGVSMEELKEILG